jgi:ribosomal protein S18 acetylase RimI-like enzyme
VESGEPSDLLFDIRPAHIAQAGQIARVHVEAWRSAYAGILPDHALSGMSLLRQTAHYDALIHRRHLVLVAVPQGGDTVVGFATAGRARFHGPAEAEIETLYVDDDWRERGIGRRLMAQAARSLAAPPFACRSLFLWVLSDNPSRWFYERLGGRPVLRAMTSVGGEAVPQTAMVWDPISRLFGA